ncbi:hypothetical protein [Roseibium sp.]|uniref:hypothetical protein n=1 Tax=Roseibium sp. TaxID=1936156 RepID=UPI0032659DA8
MSEPRVPFVSKSLQRAVHRSFVEEIAELVQREQAAYVDTKNTMKFQHGKRWTSPANVLGDKEGELEQHSVESALALADVVKADPSVTFAHTGEIAGAMMSSFNRMFFTKMNEVTAQTGNVVHAADHKSQLEAFAATLETIEMSIDEDGNLNLPTIFIHPNQTEKLQKEIENAPPDMHKRIESIKAMKLKEATQKEEERKSRFERRGE